MTGAVLPFRRRPAAGVPGSEVYVVEGEAGGWLVIDASPSGGSAGRRGPYDTQAEAAREGRRLAREIGGTFLEDDGGAAA